MMRLRLMLAVLALVAGGALLWEADSLKAEVEDFAQRETKISPVQFPTQYPRVTRIFEKRGLYPVWPDDLSPVEAKSLLSQLLHDAQLRHGQLIATGWSLLAVGGFGLWLHYRCPACRIQTRKETPSC